VQFMYRPRLAANKKQSISILLATVVAAGIVGTTAGPARAAGTTTCSGWSNLSGGVETRTCIVSDASADTDYAFVQFYNNSWGYSSGHSVYLSVQNRWTNSMATAKSASIPTLYPSQTYTVYTSAAWDFSEGPERAVATVNIPNSYYSQVSPDSPVQ
jgi:hypothetical protein